MLVNLSCINLCHVSALFGVHSKQFAFCFQSAPAQPPTGDFVRDSDGDTVKKAKAKTDDGDEGADGIASLVGSTGFAHAFIATLR